MNWLPQKLGNIVSFKTGKLNSNAAFPDGIYPFFTCAQETFKINTFSFDTECVLLAGNNANGIFPIKYYSGKFDAYQRTYVIEPLDRNALNTRFLFYALYLKLQLLQNQSAGTATKYLTLTILDDIDIEIPNNLHEQLKIADLLSAYDDLIANNTHRKELLEESIRLLYRDWFVHLHFPGYERVKIIDAIPEGWEKKPLADVCELTMGQSPPSEYYNTNGEGLPFHQGVTDYGKRFITHRKYCTQIKRVAEPGDILFSVRAPVGRINITLDRIVIGRGLAAIRNKQSFQSFQYYQLKSQFHQEDMIGGGAIFASVTKKQLSQQMMLQPKRNIIDEFERIAIPVDQQIANLHIQNQRLVEARDILLPRLMNGSIPV